MKVFSTAIVGASAVGFEEIVHRVNAASTTWTAEVPSKFGSVDDVKILLGAFRPGDAEYKTSAGVSTNKVSRSEYGIVYGGMADSTLYWTVSEEKESQATAETFTHTHIGMMYTVAPGLTLKVENGTEELKTAATESTYNAVGLSFAF